MWRGGEMLVTHLPSWHSAGVQHVLLGFYMPQERPHTSVLMPWNLLLWKYQNQSVTKNGQCCSGK